MRRCRSHQKRGKPSCFVSKFLGFGFVVLGFILLLGFLTNARNFRIFKIFFGDASYLIIPICFLIAYFLSHNRLKKAFYTSFILPISATLMPFLGLKGGVFANFSKNIFPILDHVYKIGIVLIVGLFLLTYGRRILRLRYVLRKLFYILRAQARSLFRWIKKNGKAIEIIDKDCEPTPDRNNEETPDAYSHYSLMPGVPIELQEGVKKYISHRNVSLKDISGYHKLIFRLKSDIDGYMQDRTRAKQYIGESNIKSYLLYGPGGTGKSYFAQCFMGYLRQKYGFIPLDVKNWQQLAGSSWQQSMKALMEFLDTIRDCRSHGLKVCITWDEFDGYIGGEMASDTKRIAAVKAAFDDWHAETASPLIFFATTNDPQEFTEEMLRPGRLQPVFFPPPDLEARRAIIQRHIRYRKVKEDERGKIVEWITGKTEHATISEIINYIDTVGSIVYERMRHSEEERPITLEDFQREPIKIRDYFVFLQKMKKKFNYKHSHKLGIFNEMEKLVVNG